ncbi:aspartate/glutamate racemase family protein [Xenophilus sp. Marseille-Q4582]|uniref:aspartate/glutamate racemase family protein n=1 Tax=Xenophilus sp. Marseille-Q4582 TaxID=2866600 RepID=UPI001CE45268|nr:aspartate/glutamate racemase family protein [Xenophilus sp. Marseille-Q4582]
MRLLIINPNTSASVSELLRARVQGLCVARAEVEVVTARLGAAYIASECSFAIAAHAALDAWAAATHALPATVGAGQADAIQASEPDAVLIGCFGDPGLFALRECSAAPVTGLAEAAFRQASRHGRFAIVTGGAAWAPLLQRHALATGFGPLLAGVVTVAETGATLAADRALAQAVLSRACLEAALLPGVQSVIVGGAGLAGMAAWLQPQVSLPLIDSVDAGVGEALALAAAGRPPPPAVPLPPWQGVSAEIERWAQSARR